MMSSTPLLTPLAPFGTTTTNPIQYFAPAEEEDEAAFDAVWSRGVTSVDPITEPLASSLTDAGWHF